MFRTIKQWKRQRREQRRRERLNDPNRYPPDMERDVVDTIIRVKDYTMTSMERLHGLCEAVRYVSTAGIEGDVVECGVWRGGSMMAIADMLKKQGDVTRHLHLFDTFCGMSDPTDEDVTIHGETAETLMEVESKEDATSVWCVSNLQDVQTHMSSIGYPEEKIHYYEGMVEDTIPQGAPAKISLLRLDTDFYESTRHEMEHLFPRLSDGGVLIVDDYGHWAGAKQAVDEYFETHGIALMLNRLDYTGRIGIWNRAMTRVHSLPQAA